MTNLRRQPNKSATPDASTLSGTPETRSGNRLPPKAWPKRIHRKKYGRWYR